MFPPHTIWALLAIIGIAALSFGLAVTLGSYIRYGGKRVVNCPETRQPAAVRIDLAKVARQAIYRTPSLKLDQCSRWPERASCGQECLAELKGRPGSVPGLEHGGRVVHREIVRRPSKAFQRNSLA